MPINEIYLGQPIAVALAIFAALATTRLLNKWIAAPPLAGRNPSIDGLRGYLGFAVFLHHTGEWQAYATTGIWTTPPSRMLETLGPLGVRIFFMITGYLFITKLLQDRERGRYTDFLGLFVSRVMRLTPLYLVAIAVLVTFVLAKTGWTLQVSPGQFASELLQWATFTLAGQPDINGLHPTQVLMAGVNWTLPYEWVFYMSLPLFAILLGAPPRFYFIVASVVFVVAFWRYTLVYAPFLGGVAAAFLARRPAVRQWAQTRTASFVVLALVIVYVGLRRPVFMPISLGALSAAFVIIASGNSMFGIFTSKTSRSLGEFTYGIYLLHGLLLYFVFRFALPADFVSSMSAVQYWSIIVVVTPVLIGISALSFVLIENPANARTKPITHWLREQTMPVMSRLRRGSKPRLLDVPPVRR